MTNQDYRFYSFFNRAAFLHAEYCIPGTDAEFNMIKFWAGSTENGKVVADASHYLTYSDLRYLCYLILTQHFATNGDQWVSIRGKVTEEKTICRVFKIRTDTDKKSELAHFVTIGLGPGREDPATGKINPLSNSPKETWVYTTLKYSDEALTRFALDMQAMLQAIEANHVAKLTTEKTPASAIDNPLPWE
jgi:hypothetical protein